MIASMVVATGSKARRVPARGPRSRHRYQSAEEEYRQLGDLLPLFDLRSGGPRTSRCLRPRLHAFPKANSLAFEKLCTSKDAGPPRCSRYDASRVVLARPRSLATSQVSFRRVERPFRPMPAGRIAHGVYKYFASSALTVVIPLKASVHTTGDIGMVSTAHQGPTNPDSIMAGTRTSKSSTPLPRPK